MNHLYMCVYCILLVNYLSKYFTGYFLNLYKYVIYILLDSNIIHGIYFIKNYTIARVVCRKQLYCYNPRILPCKYFINTTAVARN